MGSIITKNVWRNKNQCKLDIFRETKPKKLLRFGALRARLDEGNVSVSVRNRVNQFQTGFFTRESESEPERLAFSTSRLETAFTWFLSHRFSQPAVALILSFADNYNICHPIALPCSGADRTSDGSQSAKPRAEGRPVEGGAAIPCARQYTLRGSRRCRNGRPCRLPHGSAHHAVVVVQ